MSAFRSALRRFGDKSQNIIDSADLEPAQSAKVRDWDGFSKVKITDAEDLADTIQRVQSLYRQNELISSGRDLRVLCQALWKSPYTLADNDRFREAFLDNIRKLSINSPLRALGRQYVFDWPESEREEGPIISFLRSQNHRMTSGWLKIAYDNGLFEGPAAINPICERLFSEQRALLSVLRDAGLNGDLVAGKLSEHIFSVACQSLPDVFDRNCLLRLLDYFSPGAVEWTNARFTSNPAKSSLISVLLGVDRSEPDLVEKRWRVTQLLRLFDDPRIRAARWNDVDPTLISITKQWLAKESLEQFLKVISDSLSNPDDKRRWKFRRAFWSSYVDSGRVTEAWVHFGPNAEKVAKQLQARTGEQIPYGRFSSANRDHSVILMRAGFVLPDCEWRCNDKGN